MSLGNKSPEDEEALSIIDRIPNTKYICASCGSNVYMYVSGMFLLKRRPEAEAWDRWIACSHKNCVNHHGEGHFQDMPDWVIPDKLEDIS